MPPFLMPITINPPAEWSTDQALLPETEVDLYRGWADYTVMWPTNTSSSGSAALIYLVAGGAGYVDGTYNGVAVFGGSGTGCTVNITISGGTATVVGVATEGTNYLDGDYLYVDSANVGGSGSGIKIQVFGLGIAFRALFDPAKAVTQQALSKPQPQVQPVVPIEDMLNSLPLEGLKEFAKINKIYDGLDPQLFKGDYPIDVVRAAVKEAYRLQQENG